MTLDEMARQGSRAHHQQHFGLRRRQQVGRQCGHGRRADQGERAAIDPCKRLTGLPRQQYVGGVHRGQPLAGIVGEDRDDFHADASIGPPRRHHQQAACGALCLEIVVSAFGADARREKGEAQGSHQACPAGQPVNGVVVDVYQGVLGSGTVLSLAGFCQNVIQAVS